MRQRITIENIDRQIEEAEIELTRLDPECDQDEIEQIESDIQELMVLRDRIMRQG